MKHSDLNWPQLIELGKKLVGKPYKFGAEVNLKNPDPAHIKAIDCSELAEWLFAQIGIRIPDGSYNQAKACCKIGGQWKEFPGKLKVGDLGFKWNPDTQSIHHVGVYIGQKDVLEAKGLKWGVVITPIDTYMASTHFAWWGRLKAMGDT